MDQITNTFKTGIEALTDFDNVAVSVGVWSLVVVLISAILWIVFVRANTLQFFRTTIGELKKVEWLGRKKVKEYTIANVGFIVFATLLIFGLDQLFTSLRTLIL